MFIEFITALLLWIATGGTFLITLTAAITIIYMLASGHEFGSDWAYFIGILAITGGAFIFLITST